MTVRYFWYFLFAYYQNYLYIYTNHSIQLYIMNRIKKVLEEQGRTKTWLSRQLGVHQTTIYKYCANDNQPSAQRLKTISDLLNVTMEDLVC